MTRSAGARTTSAGPDMAGSVMASWLPGLLKLQKRAAGGFSTLKCLIVVVPVQQGLRCYRATCRPVVRPERSAETPITSPGRKGAIFILAMKDRIGRGHRLVDVFLLLRRLMQRHKRQDPVTGVDLHRPVAQVLLKDGRGRALDRYRRVFALPDDELVLGVAIEILGDVDGPGDLVAEHHEIPDELVAVDVLEVLVRLVLSEVLELTLPQTGFHGVLQHPVDGLVPRCPIGVVGLERLELREQPSGPDGVGCVVLGHRAVPRVHSIWPGTIRAL